jgi:hypothetical protein
MLHDALQSTEPTRVTVSGNVQSLSLAVSMITDICKGTFKGFALLRQLTQQQRGITSLGAPTAVQTRPVYAPGYGLIPPSQVCAWAWTCMHHLGQLCGVLWSLFTALYCHMHACMHAHDHSCWVLACV